MSTWQALTWPSRQHNEEVHKLKVKLCQQKEFALNDNTQLFEVSLVKMVVYVLVHTQSPAMFTTFSVA